MMRIKNITVISLLLFSFGCSNDTVQRTYKTENVIIIVIDGPRYSETWGEPNHLFIPNQSALRQEGTLFSNFSNEGTTRTIPGHTAITTGVYQNINNSGQELPNTPSIFQAWRKATGEDASAAWVVASKGKLEVLGNCSNAQWNNEFMPSTNCGIGGGGATSGKRDDSTTMIRCMEILDQHHPKLMLINFKEPDNSAHQGDWNGYINGIIKTDEYVQQIWDYIKNDPIYQGKTTVFITNDHGRHLNSVSSGYVGHGDECAGCKHIGFLALGPDFTKNKVIDSPYDQTDIASTIAELLHFDFQTSEGNIIFDLFE